ncbi:phage tail protein [Agrobacterium sp. Ap1]|uniref:gpW family head-tail joining protein n=1 Tax=Agrobacterium sp. Ap1 TaxID=2815337 RepID=UPI001A8DB5F2|nr:gpW family head-tail joining protein [Agrobacterium sp. Ap1]MBO0142272.1 phage tail protein [Agrobacterium sp. Ap1]
MQRPTTPEETALYQSWLTQAKTALHQLAIGKKTVTLSYNGETITYDKTDEGRLRRYIGELEVALGIVSCVRRPGVRA